MKSVSNEFVGIDAISHLIKPPESAGVYFGDFLKRKNLTPNAASKQLKVSQSTVQRLVDGAQLSENMAARIKLVFGIDPEILMKIEAKYRAYAAEELAKSDELKAAFA